MEEVRSRRSPKTALAQIWLTVLPLLALVALWPSSREEAPASSFTDGGSVPFVSADDSVTVIIETHAPVVLGWALVVLGVGLSAAVVAGARGPASRLRRLSVLGRVALVVVALAGGAFASLPVQAHVLGWDRGEVPAAVPWWSNASFSWIELH
jgi:hypothetical protein